MLDKNVPFYAVAMYYEQPVPFVRELPNGYSFVNFEPGMEFAWSRLQYSVGNFTTLDAAQKAFDTEFSGKPDLLRKRMIFVCDEARRAIACACLWVGDDFEIPMQRLHWLATAPGMQGKGIATAMLARLIDIYYNEGCTEGIYLLAHTYSYAAIYLYRKCGFKPYTEKKPKDFRSQGGTFEDETRIAWEIIGSHVAQYQDPSTMAEVSLAESVTDESGPVPNMLYFEHGSMFNKCKSCKVFEITAPNQSGYTLHSHDYCQIWFVTRGSCCHTMEGQDYKMIVGDAFLLPPKVTHRTIIDEGGSIICCEFFMEALLPGANVTYLTKMIDLTQEISFTMLFQKELHSAQPKFTLSHEAQRRVAHLMSSMVQEYSNASLYYEDYLHLQILELLLTFVREYSQFPTKESPEKVYDKYRSLVENAICYINEHYDTELTLDSICKISMVSKTYFCYLFKLLTQQTFIDYLTTVRIEHAMEQLRQSDHSIIDISENVGFKDSTHFSRTFKRLRGISPREYRLASTQRSTKAKT